MEYTFDIRPYKEDDVQALYEAACESVNDVYPWLPWCHPDYALHDAEEWIHIAMSDWQRGEQYPFVIYERETQQFVGGCGLNAIHTLHRFANLGYWVRSSWAGRGAATQATRHVALYGFEHLSLNRIEILASVENNASKRAAEKSGATYEGILRNRLLLHGIVHDAALYSFTPDDFLPPTQK